MEKVILAAVLQAELVDHVFGARLVRWRE